MDRKAYMREYMRNRRQKTSYKLTPLIQDTICNLIADGNYIKTACLAAGVHKTTFDRWLKLGEQEGENEGENPFTSFANAVKKAEAENIARNVGIIQKAAVHTWQAAAWLLERKYPAQYGKRVEIELGPSKVLLVLQDRMKEMLELPAGNTNG